MSTGTSKSTDVIQAIRDGMLNGKFRQGQLLSEQTLEDELRLQGIEVSRVPIRQAIAHFESEQLMEVKGKKGTLIRTFEAADIKEIWDSRVAMEDFAIVALARKRQRDLSDFERIQSAMMDIAKTSSAPIPTPDEQKRFVDYDQLWHEQIARSAGYPRLAEELRLLRFKLRFAVNVSPSLTKKRMEAIVTEHQAILDALAGGKGHEGIHPDINRVRFTFLIHMRNAGRDSWRIADRIKPAFGSPEFGPSDLFDLPEFAAIYENEETKKAPLGILLDLRLCTEMCAVWHLAMMPEVNLELPESLNAEMKQCAQQFPSKGDIPIKLMKKFITLDISFHCSLCFISGMLFGDEAISYVWRTIYNMGEYRLDQPRAQGVLDQHDIILGAIKHSRGTVPDAEVAAAAIQDHLLQAFAGNNFSQAMLRNATKEVSRRLSRLRKLQLSGRPKRRENHQAASR